LHTATFTGAWLAAPVFGVARPKIVVVNTETVRSPAVSVLNHPGTRYSVA
jgi:hypothetical protein